MKAGTGIMMDHDTQGRTDFRLGGLAAAVSGAAVWPDVGDAGAAPARLLFVGPQDRVPETARVDGVRLVATIAAPRAAGHLRQMGAVDVVWLATAEAIEIETLADICAAVAEREGSLICETSLA